MLLYPDLLRNSRSVYNIQLMCESQNMCFSYLVLSRLIWDLATQIHYIIVRCAAKTTNRKIIIIASITSVLLATLIVAVIGGAILDKNRRYRKYLQLQFCKSEYSCRLKL